MNKNLLLFIVIMVFIIFRFSIQGNDKIANTKINKLLEIANSYTGVSYKAGGTTKNGMDCSGLVNTSFKQVGIQLPRSSKAMSVKGKEIALIDVRVGDLLFFDIARLKGEINHVGLITLIENDEIFFMHSTTSKGVVTSSMKETYWENEFVKATRVL
ncbi:C40 family peptidase [Tenacibaculum sp. HL-MS23]|uniref:C40 family peptidase n=1 Tax=Tenacibaculum sp. HL-MS23 TaxID=3077734 RepID=UPI0028FC2ADD|nr:C40 family peptidase [Tenacibaculum sp. HL-MS23]WNW01612.1 C40 family peptidase [Tenacibaculum sp. HL-MS23]